MGTNENIKRAPASRRKEWLEYTPELIDAIRSGYLDDVLMQINHEAEVRRELVRRYGYYAVPRKTMKRKKVNRGK